MGEGWWRLERERARRIGEGRARSGKVRWASDGGKSTSSVWVIADAAGGEGGREGGVEGRRMGSSEDNGYRWWWRRERRVDLV